MKEKKKSMLLGAIIILMSMFFIVSHISNVAAASKQITLRMSSHLPLTWYGFKIGLNPYAKLLEKESKGRLRIKFYPGGVLHGPKDGFKACVTNITDLTHGYPAYVPGNFHLMHCDGVPFLFPANASSTALMFETTYSKYFKKEYEGMGVYLLCSAYSGSYCLLTTKPVRKLEDLKGMKIRSGGAANNNVLRALGAVPVAIPNVEAYTAMQRGTVDGTYIQIMGMWSNRQYEVAKYITKLAINGFGVQYAMNRKTYDSLPKDLQTILYNTNRKASQLFSNTYDLGLIEGLKAMRKAGVEVIELPPAELVKFKDAVKHLEEEFIQKNEAEGRPARQMIEEIRALGKKYGKMSMEELFEIVSNSPIQGIID